MLDGSRRIGDGAKRQKIEVPKPARVVARGGMAMSPAIARVNRVRVMRHESIPIGDLADRLDGRQVSSDRVRLLRVAERVQGR